VAHAAEVGIDERRRIDEELLHRCSFSSGAAVCQGAAGLTV
jgi:hypothetical protein